MMGPLSDIAWGNGRNKKVRKFTDKQVREIRAMRKRDGLPYTEIAKAIGNVSAPCIREICILKRYRDVE